MGLHDLYIVRIQQSTFMKPKEHTYTYTYTFLPQYTIQQQCPHTSSARLSMTSNFHKSFDKRRFVSYLFHIFLPSEILYSGTVFAHAFSLRYDTRICIIAGLR